MLFTSFFPYPQRPSSLILLVTAIFVLFGPAHISAAEFRAAKKAHISDIISPTQGSPKTPSDTGVLEILVRLRLPLTPPPGVQQPKANTGWRIFFIKKDVFSLNGAPSPCTYEHPVMRLRPVEKDVYKISIEVVPWLLSGFYDLHVVGPGFDAREEDAIIIASKTKPNAAFKKAIPFVVKPTSKSELLISQNTPTATKAQFNVTLPKDIPGIVLKSKGQIIPPNDLAFAGLIDQKTSDARVLSFSIQVPANTADNPNYAKVSFQKVATKQCQSAIQFPRGKSSIETLDWRGLSVKSNFSPVRVIWDFGDGRWGIGTKTRHRWLLANKATVTATTFDKQGRQCTASDTIQVNTVRKTVGCSCNLTGQPTEKSFYSGLFFLFIRTVAE